MRGRLGSGLCLLRDASITVGPFSRLQHCTGTHQPRPQQSQRFMASGAQPGKYCWQLLCSYHHRLVFFPSYKAEFSTDWLKSTLKILPWLNLSWAKKPRSNNQFIDRYEYLYSTKKAHYKQSRYFKSENNQGQLITLNTDWAKRSQTKLQKLLYKHI